MADARWRVGEACLITAPFRKRNGELVDPVSGPRFTVIRPDTPDVKTRYTWGVDNEVTRTDGQLVGSFDLYVLFDVESDWTIGVDSGESGAVDEIVVSVYGRATA